MYQPKKILIFDISGTFAHFKKYYTNASRLTYGIPTRTVITGLIAGILGFEKDTYHEKFTEETTRIGIRLLSPYRKIMQGMNFYNITKKASLRSQAPMEILVPEIGKNTISFRVYFSNEKYTCELQERISHHNYYYNPYLGITEFLADINFIDLTEYITKYTEKKVLKIQSCFKKEYIEKLDSTQIQKEGLKYIIDRRPEKFNNNREFLKFSDYIYDESCKGIFALINDNTCVYKIDYSTNGEENSDNIIFVE
jgi:CRISPR-associated protein Cas5h